MGTVSLVTPRSDDVHGARPHRDSAGYCDLRDYAAIGDGRTVALIGPDGRVDWLPLPDLISAPAFASLLDSAHGGYIALAPVDDHTVVRNYDGDTNVLIIEYHTATGSVRVTDALNTGVAGRLPWAELARRVDGLEGSVRLRGVVAPGTCLNMASPWLQDTVHGTVMRLDGLTMAVRTLGDDAVDVRTQERSVVVDYTTTAGSRHLLAVVGTEREPLFLPTPEDVDAGVDRTIEAWNRWSELCGWDGPWGDQVRRTALVLKLLINAPTGAVAAAATTSLPESAAGGKNWDYRYAWVRDTAYTLTALFRFGLREEIHAAMSWMLGTIRRDGPEPSVFYHFDGSVPETQTMEHDVPGWRGIGPVVSGNGAAAQLQLGVYGDLFNIVQLYVDGGNILDAATGRTLAEIADIACDRWRSKDAGMWELHEPRHYVTSKMGCWQALQHAVHLAEIGQIPGDPSRWRSEAALIRAWVDEHGWSDERQSYVWYAGSEQLDASVLLHAISGFDRGPRMRSTLRALEEELGSGPHLYRYSGAEAEEHAFVACSFWFVSALHLTGQVERARVRMNELMAWVPDTGVLAEMADPQSGSSWGNLPQALSHLALLNAAITLTSDGSDS